MKCSKCKVTGDSVRRYQLETGSVVTACQNCAAILNEEAKFYKEAMRRQNMTADKVDRCQKAFFNLKQMAKVRKFEHDIDMEWIKVQLIDIGKCPVTGIPFMFNVHGMHPFAPALDRIKRNGPWSKANCRYVVRWFIRARGRFTDKEFIDLCRKVVDHNTN